MTTVQPHRTGIPQAPRKVGRRTDEDDSIAIFLPKGTNRGAPRGKWQRLKNDLPGMAPFNTLNAKTGSTNHE